jgi:hypothetical protein
MNTTPLAEGSQLLAVEAYDAAENVGSSAPLTVRVDNTAPGAVPVALEGGDAWRNKNTFNLAWTNPYEADRAPISAAHYRLCQSGSTNCITGIRAAPGIQRLTDISVPGPGEWQARLWREDAAGNREPANASVQVTLRFDGEPPELAFEPLRPSDPTLISVLVNDNVSGLAHGQIELSRSGTTNWQVLPTAQQGSRLVARINDALIPPGAYILRATAQDRALNQNSTDRLADGRPMAISLPLRIAIAMRAGVVTKRTVKRKIKGPGKRRTVRRRRIWLNTHAQVEFGRPIRIAGRLENSDGDAIPGAEVHVFSRSAAAPEQQLGVVRTDEKGRFSYLGRASASQTLRLYYGGTPLMLPTEREVTLSVPAVSTIRARPRHLLNGRTVRFSGQLRSRPAPAVGKLVELQVLLSGRWQTFRTTRTGPNAKWEVRYRFRRSCGLTRYRFRARLPAEASYPFDTGRTRSVDVRVRGGRCR